MKKFWSLLFLLLINCAVSTAQSFHFKGLDLDTGANLVRNVYFDLKNKNVVFGNSSLLWHKSDSFNRNLLTTNFSKLNHTSDLLSNHSIRFNNKYIESSGTIKLLQGGYMTYGYQYNTKTQAQGITSVPGCVVRYNENGDTLFTKLFYFNTDKSEFRAIRQSNDSSVYLVSIVTDTIQSFTGLRLIKLDSIFNTIFDKIYYYSQTINFSQPRIVGFNDAIEINNDGSIFIGSSLLTRADSIRNHALLFKIDKNGMFQWERRFEFEEDMETEIKKIIRLKDGNLLLVGYYNEFWIDPNVRDKVFLIKLSTEGVLISKKLIYAYKRHIVIDAYNKLNGDILLAGSFCKAIGDTKYKAGLMCLNSRGDIKWHRQYELPSNMLHTQFESSDLVDIEIADDGTIMAVGNIFVIDSTIPYNNGGVQDLIFLYTDSNGCVDPSNCTFTTVEEEQVMPLYFQVYPNPSRGKINFSTNINSATSAYIKIYNNLGQLLFEKEILNFEEEVDVSTLPKGMYILELDSKEFRNTQKLLIE